MKLLVVSDLHLEFGVSYEPPSDSTFDVVILAGDIHAPGIEGVTWAAQAFSKPVIYVPGNHEYYRCDMDTQLEAMRREAEGTNVVVMDRDVLMLQAGPDLPSVRFVATTLWTDFRLMIEGDDGQPVLVRTLLDRANRALNDFRLITREGELFTAEKSARIHGFSRQWLGEQLALPHEGPTVVITHHGPSKESVAQQYENDTLTPAFVSNLEDELFEVPALWVHGHTHAVFDYRKGNCRVVCNPRGYPLSRTQGVQTRFECGEFNPGFVVEV